MKEFNSRIELQREVIKIINNSSKFQKPIAGISKNAIDRWGIDNNLSLNAEIIKLLYIISDKLFFLANKSQEQITESYIKIKEDVSKNVYRLKSFVE